MKAFYANQFALTLPDGHRFPMEKYRLLHEGLLAQYPQIERHLAPEASDGELALAHVPSYIAAISDGSVAPAILREIGFPWSPGMAERARRSVGATLAASRVALVEGVAANLAGGTHHASTDRGSGFCVFNDAAVAARLMQAEWARSHSTIDGVLPVAIVDLDVHQGNGTAFIFRRDDSVFTLSLHGEKNFPFRKEASDLDVALPDGCGDEDYLDALDQALAELTRRFNPGFLIYLAGADPLATDRLGRLALSPSGLKQRDQRVFEWAYQRHLPLALCMAGGYGKDISDTVAAQLNTFSVALDYWEKWRQRGAATGAAHQRFALSDPGPFRFV
jgi:acetoin utilization deacetylase AcuC-like enzyme